MPCFSPLDAWQLQGGEVVFHARGNVRRELQLPCGQCVGCRLERSRQWAVRCMHESQMHESSYFVTLTYNDDSLPADGSLDYSEFQRFMKRLRKAQPGQKVRFYMCGEYGEKFKRPHYHACLFGPRFNDLQVYKQLPSGSLLYTSDKLASLWPLGFSSLGDVTFESAAYVARYIMKKATGPLAQTSYQRVDADTGEIHQVKPEFTRMSLKPGIGARWLEKYRTDVYPRDKVHINGMDVKPPRYYDKQLEKSHPDIYEHLEVGRYNQAIHSSADNTADRLRVKERVTKARLSFKKRTVE